VGFWPKDRLTVCSAQFFADFTRALQNRVHFFVGRPAAILEGFTSFAVLANYKTCPASRLSAIRGHREWLRNQYA